jgi:hypothetical protein
MILVGSHCEAEMEKEGKDRKGIGSIFMKNIKRGSNYIDLSQ